jgi:hypothetical protein
MEKMAAAVEVEVEMKVAIQLWSNKIAMAVPDNVPLKEMIEDKNVGSVADGNDNIGNILRRKRWRKQDRGPPISWQ